MTISLEQIKELRKRTGVGIHQVKEALTHSNGDVDKAIAYLREKGIAKAASRVGREANNGIIGSYTHSDNRMAVIVELNSETDFASRSDAFKQLAKDIALHIAASDPQYIKIEDVPADVIEKEKQVYISELDGKPENIKEKILEGKLQKFYDEIVLMEQAFVKDDTKKIKDVINDATAAIGEKIEVGRFARIQVAGTATASI